MYGHFMLTYILIFCTGTAIFSYLNKVIYRIPIHPNLIKNRNNCKSNLSPCYLIIDLLGGLTAVGCALKYGLELRALIIFAYLAILTIIAVVDKDTTQIPNIFIIGIITAGLISAYFFQETTLLSRVTGIVSVSGILLIITLIAPGAFGGGDIKLMAASGIFLGSKLNLIAFIIAILTAGIYITHQLVTQKKGRKDHIAFGPFLCLGIATAILYGEQLLQII